MRIMLLVILVCTATFAFDKSAVRAALPPLSVWAAGKSAQYQKYLDYYGVGSAAATVTAGTFTSDSFTCVGQIFAPAQPKGTVFLQHGLFDHAGILVNGIDVCLKVGFAVAVFDMPGHGLSSGEPAGISSFSEYAAAFSAFIELCKKHVDTPYVFIGHSTGCALGYQYVYSQTNQPFTEIVFVAPLARSAYYHLSLMGNAVLPLFTRTTTRLLRKQSHDDAFCTRLRNDPLQAKRFPLRWAAAYFTWWKSVQNFAPRSLPLTIIQGTADDVVDWRYNMQFYRKKVPGAAIHLVKEGRHQLLNETPEYREECMRVIVGVLKRVGV